MKSKNAATLVSAMLVLTACVEEPRSSAEVVLGQAQSASQAQGASLVERLEQDRGSIAAAQAQPRSVVTPESKSVTQTPRADASVASAEQTGSERPTADSLPGTPSLAPAPQQPPVEIAQADPKPMTESDQPRIPVQDTVQETTQETRSTRIVVPPTAEQPTAATPSVSKPVATAGAATQRNQRRARTEIERAYRQPSFSRAGIHPAVLAAIAHSPKRYRAMRALFMQYMN